MPCGQVQRDKDREERRERDARPCREISRRFSRCQSTEFAIASDFSLVRMPSTPLEPTRSRVTLHSRYGIYRKLPSVAECTHHWKALWHPFLPCRPARLLVACIRNGESYLLHRWIPINIDDKTNLLDRRLEEVTRERKWQLLKD